MRLIGWEQDFPSAHVESGQPHSNCLTNADCLASLCFSISWLTMASTVSAVWKYFYFTLNCTKFYKIVDKTNRNFDFVGAIWFVFAENCQKKNIVTKKPLLIQKIVHLHIGFSWLTSSSLVHSFLSPHKAKFGVITAILLSSG